jgi:hypothetical protein
MRYRKSTSGWEALFIAVVTALFCVVGFCAIVAAAVGVFYFIGRLTQMFAAQAFNYNQPVWVFGLGWFLVAILLNMLRGKSSK